MENNKEEKYIYILKIIKLYKLKIIKDKNHKK